MTPDGGQARLRRSWAVSHLHPKHQRLVAHQSVSQIPRTGTLRPRSSLALYGCEVMSSMHCRRRLAGLGSTRRWADMAASDHCGPARPGLKGRRGTPLRLWRASSTCGGPGNQQILSESMPFPLRLRLVRNPVLCALGVQLRAGGSHQMRGDGRRLGDDPSAGLRSLRPKTGQAKTNLRP